ncbi:IS3 family transposase [Kibdelosporangium aridum]|uniref:IS3 family transposase n=1 Tax=Kibdelosporangium aridum TaxID=2030 RepID=UPI0035EED01B
MSTSPTASSACPTSGYYDWRDRVPSTRTIRQAWLTDQIHEIHIESFQVYGVPRIHAELTLGCGITVGHNTIGLLIRRNGIKSLPNPAPATVEHDTHRRGPGRPRLRPWRRTTPRPQVTLGVTVTDVPGLGNNLASAGTTVRCRTALLAGEQPRVCAGTTCCRSHPVRPTRDNPARLRGRSADAALRPDYRGNSPASAATTRTCCRVHTPQQEQPRACGDDTS